MQVVAALLSYLEASLGGRRPSTSLIVGLQRRHRGARRSVYPSLNERLTVTEARQGPVREAEMEGFR